MTTKRPKTKSTRYVALLRGINVGGNNKVEMSKLKTLFTKLGCTDVVTYINSGNVIFDSAEETDALLLDIEKALKKLLGFPVRIVLREIKNIRKLASAIPADWTNDTEQRTEVLFLWKEFDSKKTLDLIQQNPGVDRLKYVPGAIVWNLERKDINRSGMRKFIGTAVYKNMTGRNVNTVRKLAEM